MKAIKSSAASLKAFIGRYAKDERRFVEALRIFEADWPVALEMVPTAIEHYFGDPLADGNPGYAALTHALAQYNKREQVGDQRRLKLFMDTFATAVVVQEIEPASWADDAGFQAHIHGVCQRFPSEYDRRRKKFEDEFLGGDGHLARVWRRIQRNEELSRV